MRGGPESANGAVPVLSQESRFESAHALLDASGPCPQASPATRCSVRRPAMKATATTTPSPCPAAQHQSRPLRAWQASRVDITENTRLQHRLSVRLLPAELLARRIDAVTAQHVADVVATLHAAGKKRQTIRKALTALAMILDHAGMTRTRHVTACWSSCRAKTTSSRHRRAPSTSQPSTTCCRPGTAWRCSGSTGQVLASASIDETLVGDYDEPRRRIRLRAAATKSGRGLWVDLSDSLADAIEQKIGPREDRNPAARSFAPSGADALRTAIGKACRAAGVDRRTA